MNPPTYLRIPRFLRRIRLAVKVYEIGKYYQMDRKKLQEKVVIALIFGRG